MSDEPQKVELLGLDIESILSFFIGITGTKAIQYLGMPLTPDDKPVIKTTGTYQTTNQLTYN